jgi:hypothetical protein
MTSEVEAAGAAVVVEAGEVAEVPAEIVESAQSVESVASAVSAEAAGVGDAEVEGQRVLKAAISKLELLPVPRELNRKLVLRADLGVVEAVSAEEAVADAVAEAEGAERQLKATSKPLRAHPAGRGRPAIVPGTVVPPGSSSPRTVSSHPRSSAVLSSQQQSRSSSQHRPLPPSRQ